MEEKKTVYSTDLNHHAHCGGESAPPRGGRRDVPQGRPQLQSQTLIDSINGIINTNISNAFLVGSSVEINNTV